MSTDTPTDTNTDNEEDKTIPDRWTAKLSLSHWLAIVAIPVGIMGALYLFWHEEKTRVDVYVYVPAHDLPAYHQIQDSDLAPKRYASRSVPSGILKKSQRIVGRYTLTSLPNGKPLTNSQLGVKVQPNCLMDTVAVSLPATPAMTFGGNLKAGDTVSITFASPATKEGVSPTPTLFSDILVLDVKAVPQTNTFTSVIVIALPKTSAEEFVTHLASTTTLVGRNLSGKENNCIVKDP